jgi:hypothetical protein
MPAPPHGLALPAPRARVCVLCRRSRNWQGDRRVLACVDGGLSGSYASSFSSQKRFNAPGLSPKMWSELWVGWFTVWGDGAPANKSSTQFHSGVAEMVKEDASFSLYMAHGGTNFGFWSGANGDQTSEGKSSFSPDITSYDYSSPISEAGDHNVGSDGKDLFAAVSSAIAAKFGPGPAEPAPTKRRQFGAIALTESALLLENVDALAGRAPFVVADGGKLPSMEALQQWHGLVLYSNSDIANSGDSGSGGASSSGGGTAFGETDLAFSSLTLHDRVQVFVDGVEAGSAYRPQCPQTVRAPAGSSMQLLVENMGRINFGQGMYDHKGLLTAPPVAGNWSAHCLPLVPAQVQALPFGSSPSSNASNAGGGPVFWRGRLAVSGVADTWLDTKGFSKGYAWINGHALGRFWETAGPQHTLFVPAPYLVEGVNELIVLDLHGSCLHDTDRHNGLCTIQSVSTPRWK